MSERPHDAHYKVCTKYESQFLGNRQKDFDECFGVVEGEMKAAIEEGKRLLDAGVGNPRLMLSLDESGL